MKLKSAWLGFFILLVGCGGGGSSAPQDPFQGASLEVTSGASSLIVDGVTVDFPADMTRTPGSAAVRVYPQAFVSSIDNSTFPKGVLVETLPSVVGEAGLNITVAIPAPEESERHHVAFGIKDSWDSEEVVTQRVSLTHVQVKISQEQFVKFSSGGEAGGTKILRMSIATARWNPSRGYHLYKTSVEIKPTSDASVFNSLVDLSGADTLDGKKTAIIIHGLNNKATSVIDLAESVLKSRGYDQIWFFQYWDQMQGIDESGRKLAEFIRQRSPEKAMRLDVYGHSMGGLVARWAIEKEGMGEYTHRLFTFGTPHSGVPQDVISAIAPLLGYLSFVNDGINDLVSSSDFITKLNENPSPYRMRILYCTFAGTDRKYLGTVGITSFNSYSSLGYNRKIDGIVAYDSAIPNRIFPIPGAKRPFDLSDYGVSNVGDVFSYEDGKTTRSLELNHSDVGGSSKLQLHIEAMLKSEAAVGGS